MKAVINSQKYVLKLIKDRSKGCEESRKSAGMYSSLSAKVAIASAMSVRRLTLSSATGCVRATEPGSELKF